MKQKIINMKITICNWHSNMRIKHKWYCKLDSMRSFVYIIAVVLLLVVAGTSFMVRWFNAQPNTANVMPMVHDHIEGTDLYRIEDSNLFYDQNTRIVYYVIFTEDSVYGRSFGLMNEYYSESEHLCRYVDGKICEVQD